MKMRELGIRTHRQRRRVARLRLAGNGRVNGSSAYECPGVDDFGSNSYCSLEAAAACFSQSDGDFRFECRSKASGRRKIAPLTLTSGFIRWIARQLRSSSESGKPLCVA